MRTLAFIALLGFGTALAQAPEKQEPAKPAQPPQQQPSRPLNLRFDQLPANDRADLQVRETGPAKNDNLPELGGKPSKAYDAAVVRGSGTSAPGSPFPADTQVGK